MKFSYLLSKDMVFESFKRLVALAVLAVLVPVAVVVAEPIDGTNATKAFNSDIALVASDDVIKTGVNVSAEITMFNNLPGQTDSTPNTMANNQEVYEGAIACSRKYGFGTQVEINGKLYTCEDRMNIRYENREREHFDIFTFSYAEAKKFGRQKMEVTVYPA
jgi:3D (Asp-Asp-Asp) domain-containing protein